MNIAICLQVGGVGDLVASLGGIQALKRRSPEAQIHFVGPHRRITILEEHPDIVALHESVEELPVGTALVDIATPYPENVEHDPKTSHLDRIAIYAYKMGVTEPEIPRLYLTDEEVQEASNWLRDHGFGSNPLVLVWRSASAYKNYPHVEELYRRLCRTRPVLILDHVANVPGPSTKGLSIRQQAAIVAHASMVVTPDTGWLHLAGALGRPIFGLYGSQSPYTRQVPYHVPGGWMQGACPFGKHLCRERVCGDPFATPPCMSFSSAATAARIFEVLEGIKTTWPNT